jgi:hypothetical protein
MRILVASLATSVLALGLAGSAPASAAGTPIDCAVALAAVGDDGHYRTIHVAGTTTTPPAVHDFGAVDGLTSIRSLATGTFDADTMVPDQAFQETTHLGTGTNVLFHLTARADREGIRASSENVVSRWGGFRRTVFAGSMLPTSYLYALHDNGSLYRYVVTWPGGRPAAVPAGQVAGFGAIRGMALIGRTPQYDALIANTTGGRLILVKIPATTSMRVNTTTIRGSTWQVFDQLVVGNCNNPVTGSNVTTLIGVNSADGEAYAYELGFLRDAGTPIRGLGRLAGDWHHRNVAGVEMLGDHPDGA